MTGIYGRLSKRGGLRVDGAVRERFRGEKVCRSNYDVVYGDFAAEVMFKIPAFSGVDWACSQVSPLASSTLGVSAAGSPRPDNENRKGLAGSNKYELPGPRHVPHRSFQQASRPPDAARDHF